MRDSINVKCYASEHSQVSIIAEVQFGKYEFGFYVSPNDISVTRRVNGKTSAIASKLGKVFFDWNAVRANYKVLEPFIDIIIEEVSKPARMAPPYHIKGRSR
jgi:hypothetical protein